MNNYFNNINDNSFSARPKEFIYLYDEFTLDEELKAITIRIQLFNEQLRKIQSPNKNERIVENQETFYLEFQKSPSKYLANYFLDLEVNYLIMLNTFIFKTVIFCYFR